MRSCVNDCRAMWLRGPCRAQYSNMDVEKHCVGILCACCTDGTMLEEDNKLDVGNRILENIMQDHCKKAILCRPPKGCCIFPKSLDGFIQFAKVRIWIFSEKNWFCYTLDVLWKPCWEVIASVVLVRNYRVACYQNQFSTNSTSSPQNFVIVVDFTASKAFIQSALRERSGINRILEIPGRGRMTDGVLTEKQSTRSVELMSYFLYL